MAPSGLTQVAERVRAAASRSGRDAGEVTLVAVSKTVGPSEILDAYATGHRDFGENRSNELAAKAAVSPADIRWHFIGTLQSRKAREVAPLATAVHSIDRVSLMRAWAKTDSPAKLLLQVNLAHEEQKHGARSEDVPMLLEEAESLGLVVSGLMLMPPLVDNAEDNRPWFVALRELRDRLRADWPGLEDLSMGMTDDFEVAVEEGATLIRVGRAIFDT